jgi:transposase
MRLEEGLNASQAAAFLQISPSVISRWAQKKDIIQASDMKKLSKSSYSGKNGLLKGVEAELLEFIEEWCQKGFDVNRFTLLCKAGTIKPEILNKTEGAAKICLSRFLAENNLTHRVATHMAQRDPQEVEAEALEFLEYICPRLDDGSRNPNYIINMDKTPVYHAMNVCTPIKHVGTRTVNMRTSTGTASA